MFIKLKLVYWLLLGVSLSGCVTTHKSSDLNAYNPECLMATESVQVLLLNDNNYQWRVQVEVNGIPGTFILDTGSDCTIITPQFARKLGLLDNAKAGRLVSHDSKSGKVRFADITSLHMADVDYIGFYAPILDLDHINRALNTEVAGILGNNLLNKTAWQIDWRRNTLTLKSLSSEPPPDAIPIVIRHNRIYLTVLVNGRPTEFALDTGAYRSVLAHKELARLQIPADKRSEINAPKIDIKGAQYFKQTQVQLDSFQVGPIQRTDFFMLTWDHNALGMDLLSSWILKVDARHRWLSLTDPDATSTPH
ncbi:MAG: hypothetical protein JWR19_598 [Pedosphaera sp.]|nr:hypothetical protein [Pedosphaera sp.]